MSWGTELESVSSSKIMIHLEKELSTPQNSELPCTLKSYNWLLKNTKNWRIISEIQVSLRKLDISNSINKLKKFSLLRILRRTQLSHCQDSRPHQSLIQNLNCLQPKKTSWINAWKESELMFATEDCWLSHTSKTRTDPTVDSLLPLDSDRSLIIKSYGSQIENSFSSTRDSRPLLLMRSTMLSSIIPWDFILGTEKSE